MATTGKPSFIEAIQTLKATNGRTTGFACAISRLLDSLSPEERDALAALVDNTDVSIRRIAELLIEHEHPIGVDIIRRHRLRQKPGGCKCLRNPLP